MRISFHGGAGGEVTGSATLVETRSARVLIDFGLYQGDRRLERGNRMPPGLAKGLDGVLITHAHLDHTGRLPLLARSGYEGPIWASPATIEITRLILEDSAHLQRMDAERENRRRRRQGMAPVEPLYTDEDVAALLPRFRPFSYEEPNEVAPGIRARVVEAGHILGSVSIELTVAEDGRRRVVVFSGDLGPRGAPLHRDPVPFHHADAVFVESTYGDREHRSLGESAAETQEAIRRALDRRGKLLVPTFAIGRAQLLLYLLAGAFKRGTLPAFPIYIDSPMAIEATKIYGRHPELYDDEAVAMHESGELREHLETATFTPTPDDSRALNDIEGPCMILAAEPRNAVIVVGYQAHGTLGRRLVNREKHVTIFGEKIPVRLSVHTINGLSGHAGQGDLVQWVGSIAPARPRLFITHGEEKARRTLGGILAARHGLDPGYPGIGDVLEL
jgi:metallo-beta-lactamase family protein